MTDHVPQQRSPLGEVAQGASSIRDHPKRSGRVGAYFSALNQASEYETSMETFGRGCDLATSRSDSSAATVLEVIDVPRSASTTCGNLQPPAAGLRRPHWPLGG
jgi:hypothetical protein